MNSETLLIQFAKWPVHGRVKTRLAVKLGDQAALDAHIRLTRAVMHNLAATGHDLAFWWDQPQPPAGAQAGELQGELADLGFSLGSQSGSDLGARMHNALSGGLQSHAQAIIIGSDCPSVDPAYVEQAISALAHADIVLGPSDDGGFVLIGARCVADGMLEGMDWGTTKALVQTQESLSAAGLSVHLLDPRWDVDEPEDWQRFLRSESRGVL